MDNIKEGDIVYVLVYDYSLYDSSIGDESMIMRKVKEGIFRTTFRENYTSELEYIVSFGEEGIKVDKENIYQSKSVAVSYCNLRNRNIEQKRRKKLFELEKKFNKVLKLLKIDEK